MGKGKLKMITRWDISAPYHGEIYEDESEQGDWVKYKDHLTAIEVLEYELRAADEEIYNTKSELAYWRSQYQELYEQQQL